MVCGRTTSPVDCVALREDYFECLHHKKEVFCAAFGCWTRLEVRCYFQFSRWNEFAAKEEVYNASQGSKPSSKG